MGAPPGDGDGASPLGRVSEVAWVFLRLGCTSFGGPLAHLGFFRAEVVERRRWLDDAEYADLVALCNFLPGPASSQVAFAIGMRRAGPAGALAASACFTAPSAAAMIAFAYGATLAGALRGAGLARGLKLATVAVVAQAVWGMGKKLCTDRARVGLCLAAATLLLAAPGALTQLAVLAAGSVAGVVLFRGRAQELLAEAPHPSRAPAAAALATLGIALVALPLLARATGSRLLAEADAFFRAGSLVFGGGHVVLPLLRAELVPVGWITDDAFLAGYGAAQAVPGPLFTFAAYLGAAMHPGPGAWLHGAWCLLAVFLPGWLLVAGALPFWSRLRAKAWAQAALAGAGAAVVGVLLAALYSPVVTEGVRAPRDAAAALVAFGLLEHAKAPPWLVVAGAAAAGHMGLVG